MKGFTLIELLIVVAIIGILVAVAVPAYKKAQCDRYGGLECVQKQKPKPHTKDCVRIDGKRFCEE